jgi:hypothetical protein
LEGWTTYKFNGRELMKEMTNYSMVPDNLTVHCKGEHAVSGKNGCHDGRCKGLKLCIPECTGCPDIPEPTGYAANAGGGGGGGSANGGALVQIAYTTLKITASSNGGSGETCERLFEDTQKITVAPHHTSKWGTWKGGPCWIQLTSKTPITINQLQMQSANDFAGRDPRDWKLVGLRDGGGDSVTIFEKRNDMWGGRWSWNTYIIPTAEAFRTLRLEVASNNGAGDCTQLGQIKLFTGATFANGAAVFNPTLKEVAVGMRLEARDRANPHMVCVATVIKVEKEVLAKSHGCPTVTIHFDGWSDKCKIYLFVP